MSAYIAVTLSHSRDGRMGRRRQLRKPDPSGCHRTQGGERARIAYTAIRLGDLACALPTLHKVFSEAVGSLAISRCQ